MYIRICKIEKWRKRMRMFEKKICIKIKKNKWKYKRVIKNLKNILYVNLVWSILIPTKLLILAYLIGVTFIPISSSRSTLSLSSPEPPPVSTFSKPLLSSTGVSKRKISQFPTNPYSGPFLAMPLPSGSRKPHYQSSRNLNNIKILPPT